MRISIIITLIALGCNPTIRYTPINHHSNPKPPRHQSPTTQPDSYSVNTNQRLLILHNQQRQSKGRSDLTLDNNLENYAQNWANHMAWEDKLYHSKIENALKDNKFYRAGENIAWNQRNPEEVVNDWMNSTGHHENIMNRNFTHVGFGIQKNITGQFYWVAIFGG